MKKKRTLERIELYGSSIGAGALTGSALNSSVPRGALIGAAGGLGVAGAVDALSRIHHAKRKRIAKEESRDRNRKIGIGLTGIGAGMMYKNRKNKD